MHLIYSQFILYIFISFVTSHNLFLLNIHELQLYRLIGSGHRHQEGEGSGHK